MSEARTTESPYRVLAEEGGIRVGHYRCTACSHDRPVAERFGRTSISMVTSGSFGVRSHDGTSFLTEGSILLGNEGDHYEAFHECDGGDVCLVVEYEQDDDLRTFRRSSLPPDARWTTVALAIEERTRTAGTALGLAECAHVLLARAQRVFSERARAKVCENSPALRRRLGEVAERIRVGASEMHLSEMARVARLSPFHLVRAFKRELGVTPYQYVIQLRLRRAAKLLRDTRMHVSEIAFEVGWGDVSNFVRYFKRAFGTSPSAFRTTGTSALLRLGA